MKILITGGHLSPAVSVIKSFPKDTDVLLVGRKYTFEGDANLSFEYRTAQDLKIPFLPITTGRLQRRFTKYTVSSLFKLPVGFFQSWSIINRYKPDVILSFGGYISLPLIIVGFIKHIPIIIHEQTLAYGLANKIASIFATKICISWEKSFKHFPKSKTVLTGLPLKEFNFNKKIDLPEDNHLPLIFVTGGSAGSHAVNALVEGCLEKLLKKFNIIHQTGDSSDFHDFERLSLIKNNLSEELKNRYKLTKFISAEDIGIILKKSKLVVSRSGINIVSELIYFEKFAILIPINKEQRQNALFLKSLNQAQVEDQNYLTSEKLYSIINEAISNSGNVESHKKILISDASEKIKKVVFSLVKS